MASGQKAKEQNAKAQTAKGIAALQPKSYSDPFGTLSNGTFTPTISPNQQQALANTGQGMNALTAQVSKPFDVNGYYNNDFYNQANTMMQAPIDRKYQQDSLALQNNLNARNQTGSSFDALSNRYLNQDYSYNKQQAELQARAASADAYNQSYNNNVTGLGVLGQNYLQQLQGIYQPMTAATNYQSAISGLQQGMGQLYGNMANNYMNKKTWFDNMLIATGQILGAVGQGAGAMAQAGKAGAGA